MKFFFGFPLARDIEATRALYDARRASYALAPLRVRVREGDTPEEIAGKIARALASSRA